MCGLSHLCSLNRTRYPLKQVSQEDRKKWWVLALPVLYALHLLEERFAGIGFPDWLNQYMGADLSMADFLAINVVAFSAVVLVTILFVRGIIPILPILVIVTVFGLNGLIHLATSVTTESYSPGTLSGLVGYLPLYWYTWTRIFPELPTRLILQGLTGGVLVHALVIVLALHL